jgi:hypothetical protein
MDVAHLHASRAYQLERKRMNWTRRGTADSAELMRDSKSELMDQEHRRSLRLGASSNLNVPATV